MSAPTYGPLEGPRVRFAGPVEHPTLADYRLISSLMRELPNDGRWTQARRGRWLKAVASTIDFIVEVGEED